MIVFDISDLVAFVRSGDPLTGVQRVQLGIVMAALTAPGGREIGLAVFVPELKCWRRIPPDLLERLGAEGTGAPQKARRAELRRELAIAIALSDAFVFAQGSVLVNLGTAWWMPGYLLAVRGQRAGAGLRYAQFVHDLVPVYAADTCVPGLREDFIAWLVPALSSTDVFLVNSDATLRDLRRAAGTLGAPLPPVAKVALDAVAPAPADPAATLPAGPYVLFVGTVEPRKNHDFAFDAWAALVAQRGDAAPQLICVGRRGWQHGETLARMHAPDLAGKVALLEGVEDSHLSALYLHALFTVFPSRYEGWGMPITESLAHGRIPVVPDAAPFTEAAGRFGRYYEPGDQRGFLDAVESLIDDEALRLRCETEIAGNFTPRGWTDLWSDLRHAIDETPTVGELACTVPEKRFLFLGRMRSDRLHAGLIPAESLLSGTGWQSPQDWGWVAEGSAALRFETASRPRTILRIYVSVRGLGDAPLRIRAETAGGQQASTTVTGEDSRWISVPVRVPAGREVLINLSSEPGEPFGVRGFIVFDEEEREGRARMLELIASDALYADAVDA